MPRFAASFVLAYHGCDETVAEELLAGRAFKKSRNDYDWLGAGIYFWEANPMRGMSYARRAMNRRNAVIKRPAVVGAVIDLGECLDLTTEAGIKIVLSGYESLAAFFAAGELELPKNQDEFRHQLDCAVINWLTTVQEKNKRPFNPDTVRGVFTEGRPIYPGSGFKAETHVQIAVRNLDCIKGVFRVPPAHLTAADA